MSQESLNLFALLADDESAVRRIPLSRDLQSEISDYILAQKIEFFSDQRKVEFNGSYHADEDEIFSIRGYPLDRALIEALENPLGLDILDLNSEARHIVALFAGTWTRANRFICFQSFDARKLITKEGITLFISGDTYTKLKDAGLTLQGKLTALFLKNELLFYSYHSTRRFLELSAYYKEATDTDLEDFAGHESLDVGDLQDFMETADAQIRKKVTLLQTNKVLDSVSVKEIQTRAKEYGVKVRVKKNQIAVPSDKAELKDLLRFLDEDYFTTILTNRKCVTNSKKYLK